MVGVAVKVTEVPAQIVVAEAAILTLTGLFGFTVIATVFDVAGLPVVQVSDDVITQFTASVLASVALV
ncbi:hypothetical protein DSECCO2_433500 [anaerobic digester metagenome]